MILKENSQKSASSQGYADLHLHSNYSDGIYTPEQLVKRIANTVITTVALTDHDTLEGIPEMEKFCEEKNISLIPGVELTSYFQGIEVHIVALGIDIKDPRLCEELAKCQIARTERICKIVELLNDNDIPLTVEDVFEVAKCKAPGRLHICRALIINEYCQSHYDVFNNYLSDGKLAYIPKRTITIEDAIRLVHHAKGVAILAHPGQLPDMNTVIEFSVHSGIDGIECFHPRNYNSVQQRLVAYCTEKNLLISGGSDFHGFPKDRPGIGSIKLEQKYTNQIRQWVYSKDLKKV